MLAITWVLQWFAAISDRPTPNWDAPPATRAMRIAWVLAALCWLVSRRGKWAGWRDLAWVLTVGTLLWCWMLLPGTVIR
jgi:hypothetical protein